MVLILVCEFRFLEVRFFLFKRFIFFRYNKNLFVLGFCIIILYLFINLMNFLFVVFSGNFIIKEKYYGCFGLINELEGFFYIEKIKNRILF